MSEATSRTLPKRDFSVEFICTEANRNWLLLQLRMWQMRHRLDTISTWKVNPESTRVQLEFDQDKWLTLFLLDWQGWPYQINTQP